MSLEALVAKYLPAIEAELHHLILRLDKHPFHPFYEILSYHMGWTEKGAGPVTRGKRLRPLLVLLTTSACGADWKLSLPVAAAVELIHNFSLVHDDIQDNSKLRHGRDSVWVKWGEPLGINTGDALFVLGNIALSGIVPKFSAEVALNASRILNETCLDLTCGQYLDMTFEQRLDLTMEDYWLMISGKTAALFAACCSLGALLGGMDEVGQKPYRDFGYNLGLAFQVQDDILGIWGNSDQMGKSNEADLVSGKKSLPVVFGLEKKSSFYQRITKGFIQPEEVKELADELEAEGARSFAENQVDRLNDLAVTSLQNIDPQNGTLDSLMEMTRTLLKRKSWKPSIFGET
jgi:geranylgeranyl diphosphate synthase, type I